ncbi:MAG TPA: hypothetical protein VFL46_08345 [Phycicoccus sp.]|nr:hypothetical protein [Phycicoccus sp.]
MTAVPLFAPEAGSRLPWRFLALVSGIPPTAWDAIVPRGRVHPSAVARVSEAVSSEVGPFRPHESVIGARLLQGLVAASHAPTHPGPRAVAAAEHLLVEVHAWCRTGWPGPWPAPHAWADFDRAMVFAGGALAAAHLADRHGHLPVVQEALGVACEVLADRALAD